MSLRIITFFLCLVTSSAFASSFLIFSGLTYSNPGALMLLNKQEYILGGDVVFQHAKVSGTFTDSIGGGPQTGSATSNEPLYLPYGRAAYRINKYFIAGIDITRPFMADDEFSKTSIVRFLGTTTRIESVDIAPSITFQPNDEFAIGFGPNAQYLSANLAEMVPAGVASANSEEFENKGNGWGGGWHAGILMRPLQGTFVGINYVSRIHFHIKGDSSYPGFTTTTGSADVTMPDTTSMTLVQFLNPKWFMMGEVDYTHWKVLQKLALKNTAIPSQPLILNYRNTWRYVLGTQYTINPKWDISGQIYYDMSPTNDANRSARAPDGNTTDIGIGAVYHINKKFSVMGTYSHAFVKTARFNNNVSAGVTQNGKATLSDDSVGLELKFSE